MSILSIIIFLVMIVLGFLAIIPKEKIYSESFNWDTQNGVDFSIAFLFKLKGLPIYYMDYYINYKHPSQHPNYQGFLERAEQAKNKRKNERKQLNKIYKS